MDNVTFLLATSVLTSFTTQGKNFCKSEPLLGKNFCKSELLFSTFKLKYDKVHFRKSNLSISKVNISKSQLSECNLKSQLSRSQVSKFNILKSQHSEKSTFSKVNIFKSEHLRGGSVTTFGHADSVIRIAYELRNDGLISGGLRRWETNQHRTEHKMQYFNHDFQISQHSKVNMFIKSQHSKVNILKSQHLRGGYVTKISSIFRNT